MRWLRTNLIREKEKHEYSFIFLIFAGLVILCLACGKKGPPVAPEAVVPSAVRDLKAEVIGDMVRLTWSVPKKGDSVFDGLKHFEVYKYESDSSTEICPGCPISFEHLIDVKLDDPRPAQVEEDRIILHDIIEPDHRYAYKVVSYHESGGLSEDSNIVRITTDNQ